MTATARPQQRPTGSVMAAAKLAFATVATRGRLITSVGGVLFFVVLALVLQTSADLTQDEGREVAVGAYFLLLLPLMCVSNASLAFGNAVQDGTLVYIWLRPIARWKLALAHVAGTVASLLPMIVALSLATFAFGSSPRFVGSVALASLLTALGYSGPTVALGARFKRAPMMALTYVILIETILVGLLGRISIRNYGIAFFTHLIGDDAAFFTNLVFPGEDIDPSLRPSMLTAVLVLTLVSAAGVGLTTLFLKRADVA